MPRSADFRHHRFRVYYVGPPRRLNDGRRDIPGVVHDPPPAGVDLLPVAYAPYANRVFTPAEMDERIKALSARLLAADPGPGPVLCWACGRACPGGRSGRAVDPAGWFARDIWISGQLTVEVYCPECFAEWGWPR